MSDSSINQLPKTELIKRMIRVHKNGPDRIINSASASEIHILERYRVTPKGEPFLLFDSGVGDISRIIIFATPKMLSILRESQNWYADGMFKVVPHSSISYTPSTLTKMAIHFLVFIY